MFLCFYKCSWALFWGNDLIFQGLLLLSEIRTDFSWGIIWPYYRGNSLLSSTLPDACELGDFHSKWLEYGLSQVLWELWGLFSSVLLYGFSSTSGGFLTLMCWLVFRWALQRYPLNISEASLSVQPFPPVFILVTLSVGTFPFWNSSFFSSTWGDSQVLPAFLFLSCCLEILSRQ